MITANLLTGIFIENAAAIGAHLKPGGTAIVSGMMAGEEAQVQEALQRQGLVLEDTVLDNRWMTLLFSLHH